MHPIGSAKHCTPPPHMHPINGVPFPHQHNLAFRPRHMSPVMESSRCSPPDLRSVLQCATHLFILDDKEIYATPTTKSIRPATEGGGGNGRQSPNLNTWKKKKMDRNGGLISTSTRSHHHHHHIRKNKNRMER
ncbi:unnamed protein product [Musa hybrid cultivar]